MNSQFTMGNGGEITVLFRSADDDLFDTADDSPVKKDIKEEEMDVDEVR